MKSIKNKIKTLDIEDEFNETPTHPLKDEDDKFSKIKNKMKMEKQNILEQLAKIRDNFIHRDIHHLTTHLIMDVITQIDIIREELSRIEIIYIDLTIKSEQTKLKLLPQAQSGERSNMETMKIKMNAAMSDINTQLALFEEHIKFYNDSLRQLDRISFAIKNRVDIYGKEA